MSDSYLKCIENSEKVSWSIEELVPDDYKFDFKKSFLPGSLTFENKLPFLSTQEKLHLNHIRSASYMNLFGFVEEFITAFMIRIAADSSFEENFRLRALLRFSEEEVKHQMLFNKYVSLFNKNFPTRCEFLSGADDVANVILSNSKLSVLFITYHIEIMTQQHYLETVKDDTSLDESFSFILKKHWQEEAQHAKLDLYEIHRVARDSASEEISSSINDYFNIIDAFIGLLMKQTEMDLESLQRCANRKFSDDEKALFMKVQHYSYIYDFIIYGIKNPTLQAEINSIFPGGKDLLNTKINSIENLELEKKNAA
jgi:hypothetical protein